MRKAKGILGVIVGLMLLFHAGGTVAVANDPGGNNGTIKIHEGNTENEPIRANDPHVCTFHIHGFHFDSNSSGAWRIEGQGGNAGNGSASGSWTANANGDWRTNVISLTPGHYKAFAKQIQPSTPGGEKQKVFWVECGQSSTTGSSTTGSTTGTTTGGTSNGTGSMSDHGEGSTTGSTSAGSTSGGTTTAGTTAGSTSAGSTGSSNGNANGNGTGGQGSVNTTAGENGVAGSGASQNLPSTSLQNLPSTSTVGDSTPLAIFGGFLVAFGAFLLRRPRSHQR